MPSLIGLAGWGVDPSSGSITKLDTFCARPTFASDLSIIRHAVSQEPPEYEQTTHYRRWSRIYRYTARFHYGSSACRITRSSIYITSRPGKLIAAPREYFSCLWRSSASSQKTNCSEHLASALGEVITDVLHRPALRQIWGGLQRPLPFLVSIISLTQWTLSSSSRRTSRKHQRWTHIMVCTSKSQRTLETIITHGSCRNRGPQNKSIRLLAHWWSNNADHSGSRPRWSPESARRHGCILPTTPLRRSTSVCEICRWARQAYTSEGTCRLGSRLWDRQEKHRALAHHRGGKASGKRVGRNASDVSIYGRHTRCKTRSDKQNSIRHAVRWHKLYVCLS